MSNDTVRAAIETRFQTQWALGAYAAVAVEYPNTNFTPPPTTGTASWCRLSVLPTVEAQASFGSGTRKYREIGNIFINVMSPLGSGGAVNSKIAEVAATIFRGKTFSGIECLGAVVSNLGNDNKGWYVRTVKIPYRYDFYA